MKRCPECRRDYYDDTLLYCLDDGNALLEGPATASSSDEPATAILSDFGSPPSGGSGSEPGAASAVRSAEPVATGFPASESPTRTQINTTDRTAIFPRGAEAEPQNHSDKLSEKQSFSAHRAAKPLVAVAIAAVVLVGGFFGYKYFAPTKQIESIAVMPFVNESGNADVEYLSDGMTETLISSLSQLPNLNVKPRSSVFRYKGKESNPQTIGKELNVQAILNGRVVQRGLDLSLFIELVDVALDKVVWSQQYNRKQSDLATLQTEIARDVSNKLRTKLSGAEQDKAAKSYTINSDAYQSYLQGHFYWNKRTEVDLNRSIDYFSKAIAVDPNFALAYSGLADAYLVLPNYAALPRPEETYPKARENALKALRIDPYLAEPHATLAAVLLEHDWKFAEAEAEYKRAIELDPKYASARQWYGEYLIDMGRFDEGLDQMRQAQQLEPLSIVINSGMGWAYFVQHRWDDAIAESLKALELDPAFKLANDRVIDSYLFKGEFEKAIEQRRKGQLRQGQPPDEVESAANQIKQAFQAGGPKAYYQKRIELAEQRAAITGKKINSVDQAGFQIRMGNKEAALDFLDKAFANGERHIGFLQLKAHPVWDPLRGEPRFKELLQKIGLPQ